MIQRLNDKGRLVQLKIFILLFLMIFTSGCGENSTNKDQVQSNQSEPISKQTNDISLTE